MRRFRTVGRRLLVLGMPAFAASLVACTETIIAAAPNPPDDVVATLTLPTTVTLRWSERPRDERIGSYIIYRNGTRIAEVMETAFVDADLGERTILNYSVAAKNTFDQESAQSASVSITTGDATPPRVIQAFPANGAGPLPVAQVQVVIVFSEAMDPATVNPTNVSLRVASTGTLVAGTVSYVASQQLARFNLPAGALPGGVGITVTVSNGVKDLAGNPLAQPYSFSFTTAENSRPRMIASDPPNGAIEVSLTPQIKLTFSERMKDNFFDIQLFEASKASYIPSIHSYDTVTNVLTLVPREVLLSNHRYIVRTGFNFPATDLADNPLEPFTILFTTLDAGPPTIVASSPSDGATGVDPAATIMITFSEPMDATTFSASTVRVYRVDNGAAVTGTITYDSDSRVLSFAPSTPLASGTTYRVLVLNVKDATGVALEEPVYITFRTR